MIATVGAKMCHIFFKLFVQKKHMLQHVAVAVVIAIDLGYSEDGGWPGHLSVIDGPLPKGGFGR